MANILLVEDDENLAYMLCENLEIEGFGVKHISRGEKALGMLEQDQVDLLLMDVDLEDNVSGFDVAENIRQNYPTLPIIFTTGKTHFKDVERGLKLRHVDYQKKPYGTKELLARINNLLNRVVESGEKRFVFSGFSFNPIEQVIAIDDEEIRIAKTEAAFLRLLCENMNTVVTKEKIVWLLWNEEDIYQKEHSLNNLAHKIRKYIDGNRYVDLITISKVGYKLIDK
ncbi:response regulator transcription factor [Dysgonomonas macrotermitis]|uniref:Two-component system, OmpR family, response regulator VicR n=1 Tax=Dysgonomonas macrotermitis TaxID=1346286 RepID=A0A1M5CXG3_9BACT|nr:response regulator transcription factor [Dysgonomonas macrotermitis]SHF59386.1 two-component system, OmpR family, response regulator VicR [Dysgonomonas macrotermitis]